MAEGGITYEGIDASANEESWKRSLFMPGEKVRFDTDAKVHGIDPHDTMDSLGTDPLTVSKSIVRSELGSDGMGGQRPHSYLEYEFEGKDGRHNAKQFMEEGGREHVYGVMLLRDERLWVVPIHDDMSGGAGKPDPTIDGPARELVGFAGKDTDELHPDGIKGLRAETAEEGPAVGEFYVQPRDGFAASGPVMLLNSPWKANASAEEIGIADQAVDKAVAKETREREDPVGVLAEAMTHQSKVWRLERERVDFTRDETVKPADLAGAEVNARLEARYLMRGRDPSDANVRMAAAMVATEGRPVTDGELSSRNLADSLSPSRLASQASALSNRVSAATRPPELAKGPATDAPTVDPRQTDRDAGR